MSNIEYKKCDECGSKRQITPMVIGGGWDNEYHLTYDNYGLKIADLCCDDCLARFVTKLLQENANA